jgi:predicted HNH restriction endonuclease
VFLRAKESDGLQLAELSNGRSVNLAQRHAMGSEWAKVTPYYLDLKNENEIPDAVPFILYAAHQLERNDPRASYLLPSEDNASEMVEGARITVQVSRIERDPAARKKCIKLFGICCAVCGFNFGHTYGVLGNGFIHVHHLQPLATAKGKRKVDPKTDLRPVCPNCHEMLHRENPPITIEALKAIISASTQP